jgi:hypothetical protein
MKKIKSLFIITVFTLLSILQCKAQDTVMTIGTDKYAIKRLYSRTYSVENVSNELVGSSGAYCETNVLDPDNDSHIMAALQVFSRDKIAEFINKGLNITAIVTCDRNGVVKNVGFSCSNGIVPDIQFMENINKLEKIIKGQKIKLQNITSCPDTNYFRFTVPIIHKNLLLPDFVTGLTKLKFSYP